MNNVYPFQLGTLNCAMLRDNSREMPLTNIFPDIPEEALREAAIDSGTVPETVLVGFNVLYVDTGANKVLIDTGRGSDDLLTSLTTHGVQPEEIDTIIITHGDSDHIGGIDSFPNAQFVLARHAWRLWTDEVARSQMVDNLVDQFIKLFRGKQSEDAMVKMALGREKYGSEVLPSIESRTKLVEPEEEFMPGFKLIAAPGHRSDHMAVEIQSAGESLLHVVDAIRHPVQVVHPEWTSFIDSFPEQTAVTNRMLLERASETDALICGAHLTFPGLGRVQRSDSGWKWVSIDG